MRMAIDRPARLAKAILIDILLAIPLLTLSAQSYAPKPGGAMTGPSAAAPAGQAPIQGTIVSIEGSTLVLAGADGGSSRVLIQPDTLILKRVAATLDSIKPGEALGVAATRGTDGSLTATVINVFTPEIWQRVRKGQFPMPSGQVMTNAEVVKQVDKVQGRTLYLKYEMLDAAILVPAGAEIRRMALLKPSDLMVGSKISVRLTPSSDGSLRASMVSMEQPAG